MFRMSASSLVSWAGCLMTIAQAYGAPSIKVDEPVHQFGKADSGKSVTHTFLLRNTGDEALQILKVEPTCGCTIADLSEKRINPGSEATLTISLKLDPRWNGQIRKAVRIESNDPKIPAMNLLLEGQAIPTLTIKPEGLYLGAINATNEIAKSIEIKAVREGVALKVLSVTCDSPSLSIESTVVDPEKSYRLDIRTKNPLQEGDLRTQVKVMTNIDGYETITIPVSATVAGSLAISPRQILLKAGTQPVTRYVVVAPSDIKEFQIDKVEAPSGIDVQVQPLGHSGYRIRLANLQGTDAIRGKQLRITTNIPQKKEILIPFEILAEEHPAQKPDKVVVQ